MMTLQHDACLSFRLGITANASVSSLKSQGKSAHLTSPAFLRLSSLKLSTASEPFGSPNSVRCADESPLATV